MRRSTDRIIVSHAGTLPRPPGLLKIMADLPASEQAFDEELPAAVTEIVQRQAQIGIDVVNDGEIPKRGTFLSYVFGRLTGVEARPDLKLSDRDAGATGRDLRDYPDFYAAGLSAFHTGGNRMPGGMASSPHVAVGPIGYRGAEEVAADIARLMAATEGLDVEAYLPACAPGTIEHWLWRGDYYKDDEEFLFALGDAMREEYKAVTDAGLILQIDDPDLPDGWQMYPEMSVEEYRKYATLRIEALNHALRDLPEEQIRFHTCWGSFHGPHVNDLPLADLIDIMLRVRAECYSIEASNPRHEHEWKVWEEVRLPEGKSLMPGVVGHASDLVEHPELVAQRLERYAGVVGKESVIAGTDCGLGSRVQADIAWSKLEDLARGAAIASERLWKK